MDSLSESALAELSNWISGRASVIMEECGVHTNIVLPSIIYGNNTSLTTSCGGEIGHTVPERYGCDPIRSNREILVKKTNSAPYIIEERVMEIIFSTTLNNKTKER